MRTLEECPDRSRCGDGRSGHRGVTQPMGKCEVAYYHAEESVREYLQMADGYDGRELIDVLNKLPASDSTVLELGMGPGKAFEILSESFRITGSGSSELFLRRYRNIQRGADLVLLDAVTMDIDRTFDCICSNKVLMHVTTEELAESLRRQASVLNTKVCCFAPSGTVTNAQGSIPG